MFLRFESRVSIPRGGFKWSSRLWDGSIDEKATLDAVNPEAPAEKEYEAFADEPALFLIFAALKPQSDDILAFANTYGSIWGATGDPDWGVELQWFTAEVKKLRLSVDLWHAIEQRDDEKLSAFVRWSKGRVLLNNSLGWAIRQSEETEFDTVSGNPFMPPGQYKRGDLRQPALDLLDRVLNDCAAWALHLAARRTISGKLEFVVDAPSLRDALWIQLAQAVSVQKQFADCKFCGKPFELSPEHNRADKQFCTDNCRVKAYQRRRKEAVTLRAAGKPLRQIAKQVGSDLETVKKWLSQGD